MRFSLTMMILLLATPSMADTGAKKRPGSKTLSTAKAESLARKFYASIEVINATSSYPNLPDTPLLSSLKPCQINAQRELRHTGFSKFWPSSKFFASSCPDGSYAVISIGPKQQVKIVAFSPHVRIPASPIDAAILGPFKVGKTEIRQLASSFVYLNHLVNIPSGDFSVDSDMDALSKPTIVRGQRVSYKIGFVKEGGRYLVGAQTTSFH